MALTCTAKERSEITLMLNAVDDQEKQTRHHPTLCDYQKSHPEILAARELVATRNELHEYVLRLIHTMNTYNNECHKPGQVRPSPVTYELKLEKGQIMI